MRIPEPAGMNNGRNGTRGKMCVFCIMEDLCVCLILEGLVVVFLCIWGVVCVFDVSNERGALDTS